MNPGTLIPLAVAALVITGTLLLILRHLKAVTRRLDRLSLSPEAPRPLAVGQTLQLGSREVPLIGIERVPTASERSGTQILDTKLRGQIGDTVGRFVGTALESGAGTYRLTFSPEVQKQLADGAAELVRGPDGLRAWVVDPKTKEILEHGRLVAGTGAMVVAAAWHVAAAVTAQKFLADIDRRLGELSVQVESVMNWLEDEERGVLLGNYRYLGTLHLTLKSQEANAADLTTFAVQLESIDRECLKVQSSALLRLKRALTAFDDLRTVPKTVEEAEQAVGHLLGTCQRDTHVVLLALRIRVLAATLRGATPCSKSLIRFRVLETQAELGGARIVCDGIVKALQEPRDSFKHFIRTAAAKKRYEAKVVEEVARLQDSYAAMLSSTEDHVESLQLSLTDYLAATARPVEFQVSLDAGGQVVEVVRLV